MAECKLQAAAETSRARGQAQQMGKLQQRLDEAERERDRAMVEKRGVEGERDRARIELQQAQKKS